MRPSTSILQLAACLSSFAPLTAAWPGWVYEVEALVARQAPTSPARETAAVVIRQNDDETTTAEEESTTRRATRTSVNLNTATWDTNTDEETATGKETGKETGKTTKKSGTKTAQTTRATFAPNDPAGGVSIMVPITTALPTPLFKISDNVEFSWNYTSLQGTPTAIDVLVSCSGNAETYTLTSNMTFATDVSFIWDTKKQANDPESPLGNDLYTLIIKDSDAEITEMAEPGYLGAFSGLKFGLYSGRPYTPLPEWECTGCNAGVPAVDRHAVGTALTMSVLTLASFTWFVVGFGLH